MKNVCQNIIHIWCAISIFIIALWELHYICKYENMDLILTSEVNGYNFTYIYSLLNIINSVFLLWILFNKFNKIINYAIVLFVINLIMGIWNISLYCNLKVIGRFNQVIILQFYIFLIELSLLLIYFMIINYNRLNKINDESYVVLEESQKN